MAFECSDVFFPNRSCGFASTSIDLATFMVVNLTVPIVFMVVNVVFVIDQLHQ